MEMSETGKEPTGPAGEEISRSSSYTQPRTLTLSPKLGGVVKINLWTGFAIEVVNSKGTRRVEQGPKLVLLEYDENLEILGLSTGKPKNTDKLLETPYLRTKNNKIADIISVETSDFVEVEIKVSYLVDFEGEPLKWFAISNYIKFLCDHVRSTMKAEAKKLPIETLYADHLSFVRKCVLGANPDGYTFADNGMRVKDVEVLGVKIPDATVSSMLRKVQQDVVRQNIEVSSARKTLESTRAQAEIKTEALKVQMALEEAQAKSTHESIKRDVSLVLEKIGSDLEKAKAQKETVFATQEVLNVEHDAKMGRVTSEAEVAATTLQEQERIRLAGVAAEAEAAVKKLQALKDGLGEALIAMSSGEVLSKLGEALSAHKLFGGKDVVDVLDKFVGGTPLHGMVTAHMQKIVPAKNGKSIEAPLVKQ